MKSKTFVFLTCASVLFLSANAHAGIIYDMYAGLTLGAGAETVFSDNDNTTNSAQSFGGMFGVDLPVFRVEAEYNLLREHDTTMNLAMANAYFKMPSTVIKPYLGAGLGIMFDGKNDKYDISFDSTAAYQGMVGVTLDVPALPFKFDVEARAIYIPDIYEISNIQPDVLHYGARLKARYIF